MTITDRFLAFSLLGAEWVMWILVFLSLISIAIMVERAIFFFGMRPDVSLLINDIRELIAKKDIEGTLKKLEDRRGIAAAVARIALAEAARGPEAVDEAASSAMIRERLRMERNLAYLGTVGNNAPFVGLFGTVIGIIQAFHHLSLNTQGGASTVMAGISEALVATAIGLLVAIPAVAAFNVFQRRTKVILGDADAVMHVVMAGLKGTAEKKGE